jgi:hypothetical protein
MSRTAIDRAQGGPVAPGAVKVTQQTAVEQSRAVAEVQSAIVVAQNCPRDLARVEAEVRAACALPFVADRAFYSVPNRGDQKPSIHLARELARIFGNIDYGVRELRRDDDAGESEIEAFAWEQERNVRIRRSFQVPHARMAGGSRQRLTNLGDIYNNNQNIGARAVRECILAALPDGLVALAADLCLETLRGANAEIPLADRVGKMVDAFAREWQITETQLEGRVGKPRARWSDDDLAKLRVDWRSIKSDGLDPASIFPSDTLGALQAQADAANDGRLIPDGSDS